MMTTSADWPQGVDPMPSMEPPSDLFDGDILGDELLDIYNAAVVGGGDDDDDTLNEIPSLLASTPETDKKENAPLPHPCAPSDDLAGDDGMGAFRPSTSFNDLSTLLPPTTEANEKTQQFEPVASSAAPQSVNAPIEQKKRPISGQPAETPAAKRRASGGKKSCSGSTKGSKFGASINKGKGSALGKQSNNTPNPLTAGSQLAAAPSGIKAKASKCIVRPPSTPSSASAVVTPRVAADKVSSGQPVSTSVCAPLVAAPTEADFKSVAQAAVSNLILNAGNTKPDSLKKPIATSSDISGEKIDTSTEHIKALTGSNWVAVCSGGDDCEGDNASTDKMNNRARRQNLTPDERARQNRDRNREHARNTRLRKKAYVEELKRTLTALVAQRDTHELEKRHTAQRELEQREVRFRVIEEFLKLRGRNEVNFARWAAILEENFSMTLPITDFREMASNERGQFEQVLKGVPQAMVDSNFLSSFTRSLGKGISGGESVPFVYNCDRNNFFMDTCTAVLDWTASTHGAIQQGAPAELALKGTLKARFSPASNKLVSVAMSFDSGIIMSQLNHIFKPTHVPGGAVDEDAAAQVAASEADAILDSLQMPLISTSAVPTNVTLVPPSAPASVTDGEKSDSSDESNGETDDNSKDQTGRRALRVRQD